MRRISLVVALVIIGLSCDADAAPIIRSLGPGTGASGGAVTPPNQNAVLFAPFNVPGCYANGSTALATNGAAVVFTRGSTANYQDNPGAGWSSCASGQARVSGWTGYISERAASQQLTASTDSPANGGGWALIAAGPTVTPNNGTIPWIDGTSTATQIVTSAATLSGLKQAITEGAVTYGFGGFFQGNMGNGNQYCIGLSTDGTNVDCKFTIYPPALTYQTLSGTTSRCGVELAGADWVRAWTESTVAGGASTPRFFLDENCTNGTMTGTTNNALIYYVARMFMYHPNNSPVSTYISAATSRAADRMSFPISVTGGNVCLSVKANPMGLPWSVRHNVAANINTPLAGAYSSGTTAGSANSMYMYQGGGGMVCNVYDNAVGVKTITIPTAIDDNLSHVFKCCASSAGVVSAGMDGGITTKTTGAGTGIIGATLTSVYVGEIDSAETAWTGPIGVSDFAVCNLSDPTQCGDWSIPASTWDMALGDSITQSNLSYVLPSNTWTVTAASLSGHRVINYAWDGAKAADLLAAWPNMGAMQRAGKVAVLVGINDLEAPLTAAQTFESIRKLYQLIIGSGAIPVPMTVLPTSTCNAACQTERASLNAAIKAWGVTNGYRVADCAPLLDNGSGALSTTACGGGTCASVDNIHPSVAGMVTLGTCAAPYFN
jgi:hypothetical protein